MINLQRSTIMANKEKHGNLDIDNEPRRAPGGERTGSGTQDVQSGRDSQSGNQRSDQQTGRQQKDQQKERNRNM
jgi:hypothetical protein